MSEPSLPSSMAREYRKGNWTLQETLILITAKKLDDERRLKGPSSSSSPSSSNRNSGELRWKWVENYCWSHGCLRSQNQCNDKWDNLLRDYKKVREYEATKSSSSSSHVSNNNEFQSYWTMEKHQRKEQKLPSNMLLQVYQAVTQILHNKSNTSQHHHHHQHHLVNVVHSPSHEQQQQQHVTLLTSPSQPLSQTTPVASQPLLLLPPPSLPPPPVDSTTPPISEGSESSGTENKHKDDNLESKRRKFEQKLGSSIIHSASELAQALGSCEEKKEKRHQDMMELHQRALHSQETRDQVKQQGITTLVSAVTNLIAVIQSLITSINKDHGGGNDDGDACSS